MRRIIECVAIVLLTLSIVNGYRIHETDLKYGINIEVLDDPLFYNTFVPIIYEFKLPSWKASDLKVKWPARNSNQCDKSDAWNWSWDGQACPVVYHYNNLIDSLLKNMSEIWKGNTFPEKSNLKWNWPLNEIVPHFRGNNLNDTELDDYIKYFEKSSFPKSIVSKGIPEHKDVNVEVYKKMLANFREKSMSSIAKEGSLNFNSPLLYTQYAVLTNSYTAIQAMQILNFYMIRNEWAEAFSSCKNQQIPQYLVTKDMLLESLGKIREQMSEYHKIRYYLTINTEELISEYYNLQLADCTYTTRNSFIVRILVPIRKAGSEEMLLNVNTIPFIRKQGDLTELCQLVNVQGQYISRNDKMNTMFRVYHNYHSNDICKVPNRSEWSVSDSCFSAIVTKNETEISNSCSLQCHTYSESNGPYFKQIAADTYAIAGSLSKANQDAFVLLSCTRNPHRMINGENNGAVIVTLPCDCVLIYEFDILTINGQCNETLTFENSIDKHVIPYLWEEVESVTTTTEPTGFTEMDYDYTDTANVSVTDSPQLTTTTASNEREERFVETFEPLHSTTELKISKLETTDDQQNYCIQILFAVIGLLLLVVVIGFVLIMRLCRRVSELESQIVRSSDIETGTTISDVNSLQNRMETQNANDISTGVIQRLYSTLESFSG